MRTSPSQCTTFERCKRAWFFQRKLGLYVDSNTSQSFGTALHFLAAAFLSGQTPPPDWAKGITEDEAAKAQRLIDKAVADKVLVYRPGLLIEHEFILPVGPMEQKGVIDCLDLNGIIEDHKTAGTDRYLKTPDDLRNDIPMMIYAGYLLSRAKPEKVWLRHNQFILSDETVTFTEVAVTPDEVRDFWRRRIIPVMDGQRRTISLQQWEDVPGHERGSEACHAYGGCAYQRICHHGVTIRDFKSPPKTSDLPF